MAKNNPHMPLMKRLHRYSEECIAERMDDDFSSAVYEAIDLIDSLLDDLNDALVKVNEKDMELKDCRNELCRWCGNYLQKHLGGCEQCRWKDG